MTKIKEVVKLKSGYANFVHLKEDFEATQMNADRMAICIARPRPTVWRSNVFARGRYHPYGSPEIRHKPCDELEMKKKFPQGLWNLKQLDPDIGGGGKQPALNRGNVGENKFELEKLNHLYAEIQAVLEKARSSAYRAVNLAMVQAYWQIGYLIVEHEQEGKERAE